MPDDEKMDLKMNYQVLEQVMARIRLAFDLSCLFLLYAVLFQGPSVLWNGCARQNYSAHSVRELGCKL